MLKFMTGALSAVSCWHKAMCFSDTKVMSVLNVAHGAHAFYTHVDVLSHHRPKLS